jgi:hypothetical protein
LSLVFRQLRPVVPACALGATFSGPACCRAFSFGSARFGHVTDGMLMRSAFAAASRRQQFILKKFVKLSLSIYSAPNLHCKR